MRLLLDENLSRRIVPLLVDAYPGSTQVALAGLERASDRDVWEFARAGGYLIVTKDDDYAALPALLGSPPRVLWLRLGNCTNARVVEVLMRARVEVEVAFENPAVTVVELY